MDIRFGFLLDLWIAGLDCEEDKRAFHSRVAVLEFESSRFFWS